MGRAKFETYRVALLFDVRARSQSYAMAVALGIGEVGLQGSPHAKAVQIVEPPVLLDPYLQAARIIIAAKERERTERKRRK